MGDATVSSTPSLGAYAGVRGGVIRNSSEEQFFSAGLVLGGEAFWKGAFARAAVMGGPTVGGEAEIGYKFDIAKDMGFEFSAKTQRYKNLVNNFGSTTLDSSVNYRSEHTVVGDEGQSTVISQSFDNSFNSSWTHGMQQTGLAAKLNFGSQFAVGLEAGTRNSLRPNVTFETVDQSTINVQMGDKTAKIDQFANTAAVKVDNGSKNFIDGTLMAKREFGRFSVKAEANIPIIDKSKAFMGNLTFAYKLK